MKHLKTAAEVIAALGGNKSLAALTNTALKSTYFWSGVVGKFPAKFYVVMTAALKHRGYTAAPELWVQEALENLAPEFLNKLPPPVQTEKLAKIKRLEAELAKLKRDL